MNKKQYQPLRMDVVQMVEKESLLAGSDMVGFGAARQSYGSANKGTW